MTFHVDYLFHCIGAAVASLIRLRTHLDGYLRTSKDTGMYMHTQPQGIRSFSSREGDGNVMQMGFCGENFRRQRRETKKKRETE